MRSCYDTCWPVQRSVIYLGKYLNSSPWPAKVSVRGLIGYLFLITDQKNNEPYFWWELAGLMSSGKILKPTIFLFLLVGVKVIKRWWDGTDGVCLPDFSSLQNELSLSSSSDTSTSSSSSLFLGSQVILFSFFSLLLALANQVLTYNSWSLKIISLEAVPIILIININSNDYSDIIEQWFSLGKQLGKGLDGWEQKLRWLDH